MKLILCLTFCIILLVPAFIDASDTSSDDIPMIKLIRPDNFWKALIGFGANYTIPYGDYYEGIKNNFGFQGHLYFPVSKKAAIGLRASKLGMKVSDDFQLYSNDPDITILDQSYDYGATAYTISFVYYGQLNKRRVHPIGFGYFGVGIGLLKSATKIDMILHQNSSGITEHVLDSSDESDFMWTLEGGIVQEIDYGFGIEASLHYDAAYVGSKESALEGEEQYAKDLSLKVGLVKIFY